MRVKRYEILLPLAYNDGTEIEREKFDKTFGDLLNEFSAVTLDSIISMGHWLYKGVLYKDRLMRFRIDVEDTSKTRKFFQEYKDTLKERFKQKDIWITAYDIEII